MCMDFIASDLCSSSVKWCNNFNLTISKHALKSLYEFDILLLCSVINTVYLWKFKTFEALDHEMGIE